jgi:spore coat polysaccharide biosynthesis protein SpsF
MTKDGRTIVATIEARMTSSRLPGKVMLPLAGKPTLERLIERLKRSKTVDHIVIATTTNDADDVLVELGNKLGVGVWRGSEEDVLTRVLGAAQSVKADLILEVTGDCPLIDWRHADYLAELFESGSYDYVANNMERSFPRGMDLQLFPTALLAEVAELTQDPYDHEHVSLYIYNHPEKYRLLNWKAEGKMHRPDVRVTLDTQEDYELLERIFTELLPKHEDFSAEDIIALVEAKPELLDINKEIKQKDPRGKGFLAQ